MIKEVKDFLEKTQALDAPPCEEYAYKVMSAVSKAQVFDIMLESPCIVFICKSIENGSCTGRDIARVFEHYIDGQFIHKGGYSSAMYCCFSGDVNAECTGYCFIDCGVVLNIEESWRHCSIYVAGDSDVLVIGEGHVNVHKYGDANVTIAGNVKTC